MSDPFSITAGVLGILAAITDLSLKFHQFQETFTEATSEVGRINDSLSEFAIILKHLEDVCASGDIPNPLRTSLSVLLDRINLTVMGMDVYVRTALKRKKLWRGAHWVFSGKEQCRQLQQHLDSYKSTLNITLTLADIISGRQLIEEKADHILSAINHTRRHITTASGSDGFILERYLSELESVYEVSTMTGGLWDVETIGREATTPRPEHHLESGDTHTTVPRETSYREDSDPQDDIDQIIDQIKSVSWDSRGENNDDEDSGLGRFVRVVRLC